MPALEAGLSVVALAPALLRDDWGRVVQGWEGAYSFVGWGGGGMGYSFVACLSHLTVDHASLSRQSTVPTPNRDTSNIWALVTLFPHST